MRHDPIEPRGLMPSHFIGGSVWADVTALCKGRGRRRAAIAYVGADAPELLPLRRGDLLVVNAGDQALLARATNPKALDSYVARGVRVLSLPTLHAKVIVTSTHAVIGSANASANSASIDEAVLITDQESILGQAAAFIDGLVGTTTVDADFLTLARATWERGRAGGPPGTGDDELPRGLFLPSVPYRIAVTTFEDWDLPPAAKAKIEGSRRRARRAAGPAATFSVVYWRVENDDPYVNNDVLFGIDGGHIYPPEVVVSEPIRLPGRRYSVHFARKKIGLKPIPIEDAQHHIRDAGGRLNLTSDDFRLVKSPVARDALLSLWPL